MKLFFSDLVGGEKIIPTDKMYSILTQPGMHGTYIYQVSHIFKTTATNAIHAKHA